MQRDFTATMPGIKYLNDITQIKCADGKLYLAAVLDCYDEAIVGFSMKHPMRAGLCCDALHNAVSRYGYQKGLILHYDHGSQYTSHEYRAMIAGFGSIRQSMGRTHCCFDNAHMERFFATLKKELIYRLHCSRMKRDEVRKIVFRWIKTYYNRRRRNTANELEPPALDQTCTLRCYYSRCLILCSWVYGFLDDSKMLVVEILGRLPIDKRPIQK